MTAVQSTGMPTPSHTIIKNVTFDLGQIYPTSNQRIYTSCSIPGPGMNKIHPRVFLK